MKKTKQAHLEGEFHTMTVRVPHPIHQHLKKKRKATGESFNKINNDALSEFFKIKESS